MPFGIILLILFCKCYNFGGLERVKKIVAFSGWKELTLSSPKIVAYEGQN
jgi:hypothetical protein